MGIDYSFCRRLAFIALPDPAYLVITLLSAFIALVRISISRLFMETRLSCSMVSTAAVFLSHVTTCFGNLTLIVTISFIGCFSTYVVNGTFNTTNTILYQLWKHRFISVASYLL